MKQLYILDSSYNSISAGTNRLLAFGLALQRKGVKVTFFYLFPYKNVEKCERYTDKLNFVYLWEGSHTKNKYLNTIRSMQKFYKLMKPEIPVYAYSLLNCIYFLRLKKGIRLYHEYTENPEVVGRMKGLFGTCLYFLYKKAVPRLNGLFVITSALRNKFITDFGANPETTYVLNMIVGINRFNKLPDLAPEALISYCGYISEYKDGVSVLVRAFHIVNMSYPEYNLRIIGKFENNKTENNLRRLVKELGITNSVEFVGSISPADMPFELKRAKVLALARPNNSQSLYGFATKIGEYLLTKRPVVLTRVGAVEEYLNDKINCILANPDSVEDFANKLLWVMENYAEASEIGKRGKEVVLKYFDSEIEAEKIYNSIFQ